MLFVALNFYVTIDKATGVDEVLPSDSHSGCNDEYSRTLFPDVEPSIMTRYNNHGKCTVPTVIEITNTAGYVLPHYIHSRSVT